MIKIAVVGLGQRGTNYALWTKVFCKGRAEIVALCDKIPARVEFNAKRHKIPADRCFSSADEFFAAGKIADAVYICTQDRDHYPNAVQAVELGYDILLEKPVSPILDECIDLMDRAKKKGVRIVVCHIMRYMPFYSTLHDIVASGKFGKITGITHTENIGYFHFAHSYVRGNWPREQETSPMLLAKCCHDFDMIDWLMGGGCRSVSSVGGLCYFNREHAPQNSGERCLSCPKEIKNSCPYDAEKLYITAPLSKATFVRFMGDVITKKYKYTRADKYAALNETDYGKCVFKCTNDVCDRQTALLDYGDGRFASITATAFSKKCFRRMVIHTEKADIYACDSGKKIYVSEFGGKTTSIRIKGLHIVHVEGDMQMVKNFVSLLEGKENSDATLIETTIESHRLVLLAEQSRKQDGKRIEVKR